MWSPWVARLASILFIVTLDRIVPSLAVGLVVMAGLLWLGTLAIKGEYLPRALMDILSRLTDKSALERAFQARSQGLTTLDAEDLARRIKARVVGQDETVDEITTQLRRRLAAQGRHRPIAVFAFAGAPGTGKTHLAKVLAEELFEDRNHLHFFDMSQFGQAHSASGLFGSPKGYLGSQSYGALTAALRDMPNAVVLLDEFEKAHPDVHKRFLGAWNDGFVTEAGDGAKLPTTQAIFIVTTNAAARRIDEIVRNHKGERAELSQQVKSAMQDAQFAPEVLSRIDEVFVFRPLRGLDLARVVALEVESLAAGYDLTIAEGGIDVSVLLEAVDALGDRIDGGVRDVARLIERQITDSLIDARAGGARSIMLRKNGSGIEVLPVRDDPSAARPQEPADAEADR